MRLENHSFHYQSNLSPWLISVLMCSRPSKYHCFIFLCAYQPSLTFRLTEKISTLSKKCELKSVTFHPWGSTVHFPANHLGDILATVSQMWQMSGPNFRVGTIRFLLSLVFNGISGCQWKWKKKIKAQLHFLFSLLFITTIYPARNEKVGTQRTGRTGRRGLVAPGEGWRACMWRVPLLCQQCFPCCLAPWFLACGKCLVFSVAHIV